MSNERDPEAMTVGVERTSIGPRAGDGTASQEDYDMADVEERLDEDPEDAKNLTDADHTEDMSTGDA